MKKMLLCFVNIIVSTNKGVCTQKDVMSVSKAKIVLEEHSQKPLGKSIHSNTIAKPFKYDLQIIVPAYNVEKYLESCIESILS